MMMFHESEESFLALIDFGQCVIAFSRKKTVIPVFSEKREFPPMVVPKELCSLLIPKALERE